MYAEIKKKILLHNPVLVSISCLFSMASEVAHDVAAFVKKIDTDVKVLMGGGYPTNSPEETLSDHNVDVAIIVMMLSLVSMILANPKSVIKM